MKLEILYTILEKEKAKIKPITTDAYQFEKNCRANFIVENLTHKVEHIQKHELFIGKEVFKFEKSL